VLVAMMILKEGQGISDEQLYEQARFNALTRSALGMQDADEAPPVESTYYLFRKRIVDYQQENGKDLMGEVFRQITKEQCLAFGVSGKAIRMDSTLIGSDITWYSRYGVVHETIRVVYGKYGSELVLGQLDAGNRTLLEAVVGERGDAVTYRSTKEEVAVRFRELGVLIYKLLGILEGAAGSEEYQLLKRVYEEQYREGGGKEAAVQVAVEKEGEAEAGGPGDVKGKEPREAEAGERTETKAEETKAAGEPGEAKAEEAGAREAAEIEITARPKSEISAKSVQSPHDPDCQYRHKGGKGVKGYSVNITETCDRERLNLIVDVQVEAAGMADNAYLPEAVWNAQGVVPEKIGAVYADGAYHSRGNQQFCAENQINLVLGGLSGKPPRYDLHIDETGELIVTNRKTGEHICAKRTQSRNTDGPKRWVIPDGKGGRIYFDDDDVVASGIRKKQEETPKEERNRRNNIEATIGQVMYHNEDDKSRYRGKEKQQLWGWVRSIWVNFRRIIGWPGTGGEKGAAAEGVMRAPAAITVPWIVVYVCQAFSGMNPAFR
jgi:hypothetical protein